MKLSEQSTSLKDSAILLPKLISELFQTKRPYKKAFFYKLLGQTQTVADYLIHELDLLVQNRELGLPYKKPENVAISLAPEILAHGKIKGAFKTLVNLLRLPDEDLEATFGDIVALRFDIILANLSAGDLSLLHEIAVNKQNYSMGRLTAFNAMLWYAEHIDEEKRHEYQKTALEIFQNAACEPDTDLILLCLASLTTSLITDELRDCIRSCFAKELIPKTNWVMSEEDFEKRMIENTPIKDSLAYLYPYDMLTDWEIRGLFLTEHEEDESELDKDKRKKINTAQKNARKKNRKK